MFAENVNSNEKTSQSQCKMILSHLQSGQKLTVLDSMKLFNCYRLSARIKNLRDMGYQIETEMVKTTSGKRIAEYRMGVACGQ